MKNRDLYVKAYNALMSLQDEPAVTASTTDAELATLMEKRWAADLGCDSLDSVEGVMALEDELGIEIPDDDIQFGGDFKIQQLLDVAVNKAAAK